MSGITHRFNCPEHGAFVVVSPREHLCPIRAICEQCRRKKIVTTVIDKTPEPIINDIVECNGHCEIIENRINSRFHFANGHLVKTTNGQPIPHDEPIFILRGRDHLSVILLEYYRRIALEDKCDLGFIEDLDREIREFRQWAIQNYDKMKQPGVTKGR